MTIRSLFGRVVLVSLAAAICVVTNAEAATIQVQAGTLTIVQAPGESTRIGLVAPIPGVVARQWYIANANGAKPTAGPGCVARANGTYVMSCSDVARVDIAFGAGADWLFIDTHEVTNLPVRVTGGDGDDTLHVGMPAGDIMVDGGARNDTITTRNATVLGGPGDDTIELSWVRDDRAIATVDCGPGSDRLVVDSMIPASVRPRIDAATCPPILRALGRFHRATNAYFVHPSFRLPENRRLRIALFRAAEPVRGTVQFRERDRSRACARPVTFNAGAGEEVRVTLGGSPERPAPLGQRSYRSGPMRGHRERHR